MELVTALGRLLTEPGARDAFARDRAAWIRAAGVEVGAQTLLDLDLGELSVQAQLLVDKRRGEIASWIPRTRTRLGESFVGHFARFAPTSWPQGHLRHLHDALAFLLWLRTAAPRTPHSLDEAYLRAHLARREGRGPVVRLAHHADLPLSSVYLAWSTGRRRFRLLLPLPVPAPLGRWATWRGR
jgi:hypothetical protein